MQLVLVACYLPYFIVSIPRLTMTSNSNVNSDILKLHPESDSLLLEGQESEKSSQGHNQTGLLLIYVVYGIHITLDKN